MKKIDIIKERKNLFKQRLKLERDGKKLRWKEHKLKKKCSHELVFKWDSNEFFKVGKIYKCFCPVCAKSIDIIPNSNMQSIEKSAFKRSKIVNINSSKSENEFNYYKFVEDEVLSNMDYYYNSNSTIEEKSETISNRLNSRGNTKYKLKTKNFKNIFGE